MKLLPNIYYPLEKNEPQINQLVLLCSISWHGLRPYLNPQDLNLKDFGGKLRGHSLFIN
jgi:hypothetical protein